MMITEASPSQLEALAKHRERQARFRSAAIEEPPVYRLQTNVKPPPAKPSIDPHKMPGSIWLESWRIIIQTMPGLSVKKIQKVVSFAHGMKPYDLTGKRRKADVVLPRSVGMFLARDMLKMSYPEIGRRFGDRDHTTVLHAYKKIDRLIKCDSAFADEIEQFKQELLR